MTGPASDAGSAQKSESPRLPPPRLGPVEFEVSTWVYTTITLMAVLVVYDGWGELKSPAGVVAVVVGPTLALAFAHTFAEVVEHYITSGHRPSPSALAALVRGFLQFLLVAVPPLIVYWTASLLFGQTIRQSVHLVLLLGAASLGFWGVVAGWRAGMRGWRLPLAAVSGLLLGLLVLALQLALKPH